MTDTPAWSAANFLPLGERPTALALRVPAAVTVGTTTLWPSPARAGASDQAPAPGVIYHPATGIDAAVVAQVQAPLRRRILRAFVGRGLLESFEAKEMLAYQHSGFSVDAGVCIEAHERAALERLLRYCARPPFAMDRLRKQGSDLVYRCAKQNSEPASDKRGIKAHELNSHG